MELPVRDCEAVGLGWLSLAADWQADVERGALAGFRGEVQAAAVFIDHNAAGDGQALSRALAHVFGGEEGLKDFLANFRSNARSGVAD